MSSVSPKKPRRGDSQIPTFSFTFDAPPSSLGLQFPSSDRSSFTPPPPYPAETPQTIRQTIGRKNPLTGPTFGYDGLGFLTEGEAGDEKSFKSRRQTPLFNVKRRLFPIWIRWRGWSMRAGFVVCFLLLLRWTLSSGDVVEPTGLEAPRQAVQPAAQTSSRTAKVAAVLAARPGMKAVDMSATEHPVTQLIAESRKKWADKVAGQSKTLKEAVAEYRRRYHRAPPQGFEHWWRYVKENNVKLVDEYDQIHRDTFLFRAISPGIIRKRMSKLIDMPYTFNIAVKDGEVRGEISDAMKKIQGAEERFHGQIDLLQPIARYLHDVTAVYNLHDYPRNILRWDHRSELIDRVEEDEYMDDHEEFDARVHGFPKACPTTSLLRREMASEGSRSTRDGHHAKKIRSAAKSFIADHRDTMDVCDHPELLTSHSAFAGRHGAHGPLEPYFSLAKTTSHADVLTVPTEFWTPPVPAEMRKVVEWKHKTENKLLWRGRTTGSFYDKKDDWTRHHRFRLTALVNATERWYDLLPAKLSRGKTLQDGTQLVAENVLAKQLDFGFTDGPRQCSEEDGTCSEIKERYQWYPRMTFDEASKSKYTMDIDGNAWSARFLRLLTSGTLVFKSTVFPEWWTDRAQAWVHYVPVSVSYNELHDLLNYFKENDSIAEQIAAEGRDWAATHWRKEDMIAYTFRLYLEWQRLLAPMRSKANFVYDETME